MTCGKNISILFIESFVSQQKFTSIESSKKSNIVFSEYIQEHNPRSNIYSLQIFYFKIQYEKKIKIWIWNNNHVKLIVKFIQEYNLITSVRP